MTMRNGVQESDFKSTGGGLALDNHHFHFTDEKRIKKKKKKTFTKTFTACLIM